MYYKTHLKRHEKIETLQVIYPRQQNLLAEIEYCHSFSANAAEPECRLITGFQGVGKTKLHEQYQGRYPRYELDGVTKVPVLSIVIPVPASAKALVTELLWELGDPIADRGTIVQQTLRLKKLLTSCGTELIILDEFQHIIDRESAKILQTTADWLKNLITATKIPIILIGMPSSTVILDSNKQLRRRFVRVEMLPFEWIEDGRVNPIRALLHSIEQLLPLEKSSNLSDPETAYRIYCASGGFMNGIVRLIRTAAHDAIETGTEKITLDGLASAYEKELAANAPDYPNPFETSSEKIVPLETERFTGVAVFGKKPRSRKNKYAA